MTLSARLEAEPVEGGIRFAYTVTNRGPKAITLRFSDACRIDVAVLDGDEEIWRFADGRLFAQVIGEETLDPGGRASYEVTWSDPVQGEFVAVGELRAIDRTCEARTGVTI